MGQRKKNQKRRDRKQRALQRRLSEGDSADYEDNSKVSKWCVVWGNLKRGTTVKAITEYARKILVLLLLFFN